MKAAFELQNVFLKSAVRLCHFYLRHLWALPEYDLQNKKNKRRGRKRTISVKLMTPFIFVLIDSALDRRKGRFFSHFLFHLPREYITVPPEFSPIKLFSAYSIILSIAQFRFFRLLASLHLQNNVLHISR